MLELPSIDSAIQRKIVDELGPLPSHRALRPKDAFMRLAARLAGRDGGRAWRNHRLF